MTIWSMILALLLLALSIGDLRYGLLFDWLNLLLFVTGILYLAMNDLSWTMLSGAVLGAGCLWLLRWLTHGGLGLGDVKMMGALGIWLGAKFTVVALFLAFLGGGLLAFVLVLRKGFSRKQTMPFGPFLAMGGYIAFLFGAEIWQWYEAYL